MAFARSRRGRPTSHQMTPSHVAVHYNGGYFQVALAEVSLAHGVDPPDPQRKGREASERGHLELVQLPSDHAGWGS
jgi:hypothetical protein